VQLAGELAVLSLLDADEAATESLELLVILQQGLLVFLAFSDIGYESDS
jgi:hypothetical protein